MKIKNEYTEELIAPSKYNPNEFTSVGVVCFYIFMLVAFAAVPIVFGLTGVSEKLQAVAATDYYLYAVISLCVSQGIILISGVVFSLIKQTNPLSGGGYVFRFDFTPMLFGCALICGIQVCFSALHTEFSESASLFGFAGANEPFVIKGSPLWAAVYLALVPLFPCIIEELAFRGIIMRGLNRFGGFASVVISSAMFALFHGNTQQLILQFLGGLAIGGCVYLTGNIAQGTVMHFFNNLFAEAFSLVSALYGLSPETKSVFTVCTTLCGLTMLIIGVWYFIGYAKNVKRPFCVYSEDETTDVGRVECGYGYLYGREKKKIPVLMSSAEKNAQASIVIDISKLGLFKKYYPDAMRFKRGAFVGLNKEAKSKTLAVILIAVAIVIAAVRVAASLFGF